MKTKLPAFFLVLMIVAGISYAFQSNSSNFRHFTGTISTGGEIVNNSNFKSYVAAGIISGVVNSSAYKNFLGFFYTWLLADDQPCTSANQCQGGFCCSNLCKSSSCPVSAAAAAGGGGGGGGEAAGGGGGGGIFLPAAEDFSVSPGSVKLKLSLGETEKRVLVVRNTGSAALTIPLAVEGVKGYMALSDDFVSLGPGESATVTLNFIGRNVGSFVGQIIARTSQIEKSIPIIIEVISGLVLFDVKLDIPKEYAEIEPGKELKAQITLLNVGAPEKVDVLAAYFIKDLRGNIIYEKTETFAVEKQLSYQKSLPVHESTVAGSYAAVIEVRYAESFAVSSQLFRVVEKKESIVTDIIAKNALLMIFLSFMLVAVISALAYKLVSAGRKRGKKSKKNN